MQAISLFPAPLAKKTQKYPSQSRNEPQIAFYAASSVTRYVFSDTPARSSYLLPQKTALPGFKKKWWSGKDRSLRTPHVLVGICGLEPQTSSLSVTRSNQLSYIPLPELFYSISAGDASISFILIPEYTRPERTHRRIGGVQFCGILHRGKYVNSHGTAINHESIR